MSVGKNGVVEFARRVNVNGDHSEVIANILIVGVDEHLGVTDGVFLRFVDPRVEGRHVDVLDLLFSGWVDLVM